MHDSAAFYPRPPLGDNIPMTIDELAVAERPMDISRSSSVINSMITMQHDSYPSFPPQTLVFRT